MQDIDNTKKVAEAILDLLSEQANTYDNDTAIQGLVLTVLGVVSMLDVSSAEPITGEIVVGNSLVKMLAYKEPVDD